MIMKKLMVVLLISFSLLFGCAGNHTIKVVPINIKDTTKQIGKFIVTGDKRAEVTLLTITF